MGPVITGVNGGEGALRVRVSLCKDGGFRAANVRCQRTAARHQDCMAVGGGLGIGDGVGTASAAPAGKVTKRAGKKGTEGPAQKPAGGSIETKAKRVYERPKCTFNLGRSRCKECG